MIRNIVFDIGRVLVEFDPLAYLRRLGFPADRAAALHDIIFGEDWFLHDRGDYMTVGDLCAALIQKHPAYAADIRTALDGDWVGIHYLKTDTAAYLTALKARGYRVYLLSNLSLEAHGFISGYPFFGEVDGGVFSYQERSCKPEDAIYRALLDRYALIPAETVFLDDNPANIEAAKRFGIHAVLFTDLTAARAQTEALLSGAEVKSDV